MSVAELELGKEYKEEYARPKANPYPRYGDVLLWDGSGSVLPRDYRKHYEPRVPNLEPEDRGNIGV